MKKIPTLFKRTFDNGHKIDICDEIYPGMEWVLEREGTATVKYDGSCCAVIDGKFYKRFDAKPGRKIPVGSIPCCDPDPVTGHWPHWTPVLPTDKWFLEAFNVSHIDISEDHTYEAIGKHFNGNPYNMDNDILVMHGLVCIAKLFESFEEIKEYLRVTPIEGIVFWKDGEPQCKIKRTDFGFEWPIKKEKY